MPGSALEEPAEADARPAPGERGLEGHLCALSTCNEPTSATSVALKTRLAKVQIAGINRRMDRSTPVRAVLNPTHLGVLDARVTLRPPGRAHRLSVVSTTLAEATEHALELRAHDRAIERSRGCPEQQRVEVAIEKARKAKARKRPKPV